MGSLDKEGEMGDEFMEAIVYVNGVRRVLPDGLAHITLLEYLRDLGLTGTKLGCGKGGCGACTVMVSNYDKKSNTCVHYAVNACLAPLYSVEGMHVISIEGVGHRKLGLHPVQESLASSYASQCGFCTPGFIMSMYALLRSNKNSPSEEEIEECLAGNLCRCTGYRPIVDAFRVFAKTNDALYSGQSSLSLQDGSSICPSTGQPCSCRSTEINESATCNDARFQPISYSDIDGANYTEKELIFPPELLLRKLAPLKMRGNGGLMWFRPVNLQYLLDLKAKHPHAKLLVGNTEVGIEMRLKRLQYQVLISVAQVPELNTVNVNDNGLEVGSALRLSALLRLFRRVVQERPAHETSACKAFIEQLKWFAGTQIRNVACIGGNICTASPISDLNPLWMASRAEFRIINCSGGVRSISAKDFFRGYRKVDMESHEILLSVFLPWTRPLEYMKEFKQAHRRDDDIAIVNGGMRVFLEERGQNLFISDASIAFGGVAPVSLCARKTEEFLIGKSWNKGLLQDALRVIQSDILINEDAPGGMVEFRAWKKRSDVQDHHSLSFDSRSGSGYIDSLSTATSSLKPKEKPKGVFISSSLTPGSCTIASVLSESETENADDNFQFSPSQGKAAHGSSSVSWDEKAEVVESLGLQTDEVSEMMGTNSVVDALDEKASFGDKTGIVDFHLKDTENVQSQSGLQNPTGIGEVKEIKADLEIVGEPRDSEHETESEGESFVDALNTIETESEIDQGSQTSQEVQTSSFGVVHKKLENSVCEQEIEQNSNSVKDCCNVMDEKNAPSPNASDEMDRLDPGADSDVNHSQQNDLCAGKDTRLSSGGEDSISFTCMPDLKSKFVDSVNPLYHRGLQENKELEAEASCDVEAIKMWTNGGLLGLKPSKPSVLAVPSSLSPDCKIEGHLVASVKANKDKLDDLVLENASHRNVSDHSSLAAPETQNPVSSDGGVMNIVDQRECHETSSRVFGLSHKILMNGFRRNVPATIPENDEVTEKSRFCDQDIDDRSLKDPFRDEAPFDWFTSSPPLEHMKISLNPSDTLQASRLKLKFSEGDKNYDSFSSFQLLPEAATSLPDSYSDDDTFCRSSPYMSDTDYLSDNHSLSNSEQWEEFNSHERKEQNVCDSVHGRHVNNNAEDSSLEIGSESGCITVNLSYLQNPAEPLPPPFPPIQWMISKTPSEKFEDKSTKSLQLQDTLTSAFEKHLSLSSVNKEEPSMVTSSPKPENKVHLKNNVREDKQNANEKETETEDFLQQIRTQVSVHLKNNAREDKQSASEKETETGDFLQQIRTQQFNLRPVVVTTSSATATTDPTINTKISAILEKANSIRQAVASNDGEESDTWSDT